MRIYCQIHGLIGVLIFTAMGAGCEEGYWQQDAAEQARELVFMSDVEVIEMSREEFAAQADARASEIDEAYLRELADTYGRLGYFDMNLDLRPVLAGSSSDWVGATYSPSSKRVTLVGEARDDVVVHEFVHALQDQHFDLLAYDIFETSDAYLSRRAVVEGDAVLAQYRFLATQDGRDLRDVNWLPTFDNWRVYARDTLAGSQYPLLFLDYVSFVYAYGLEYAAANLLGVTYEAPDAAPGIIDWNVQDELFVSRPPATTEQVLDRDVNGEGAAVDPVVPIGLRAIPATMEQDLALVDWDSLGAWYVYLLFLPLELAGNLADAAVLAAAWDGDSALFARDTASNEILVLWTSIWDDDQVAAAIVSAIRELHSADTPVDGYVSPAADGEPLWVEQRGAVVVVGKNMPEALAPALVDAAFATRPAAAPRLRPSLGAALERLRPARKTHQAGVWHAPEER